MPSIWTVRLQIFGLFQMVSLDMTCKLRILLWIVAKQVWSPHRKSQWNSTGIPVEYHWKFHWNSTGFRRKNLAGIPFDFPMEFHRVFVYSNEIPVKLPLEYPLVFHCNIHWYSTGISSGIPLVFQPDSSARIPLENPMESHWNIQCNSTGIPVSFFHWKYQWNSTKYQWNSSGIFTRIWTKCACL